MREIFLLSCHIVGLHTQICIFPPCFYEIDYKKRVHECSTVYITLWNLEERKIWSALFLKLNFFDGKGKSDYFFNWMSNVIQIYDFIIILLNNAREVEEIFAE